VVDLEIPVKGETDNCSRPLGHKAHVVYGERDASEDFQHEHAAPLAGATTRGASVT
jgi:hypothetical protein